MNDIYTVPFSPAGNRREKRDLVAWLDEPDAPKFSNSVEWSRRLGERGLLAPSWSEEHGGRGLGQQRQYADPAGGQKHAVG